MDRLFEALLMEGFGLGMILLTGKAFRSWNEFTQNRRSESNSLLPLPGSSFQRNLAELDQFLVYSVAVFLFVPTVFLWRTPDLGNGASLTFLAGLICLSAYPGFCVIRLRRRFALEVRAERAVGRELSQLERAGCRVFHDYMAASDWKIDHIVVAPSGVYAIETITEGGSGVRDRRQHEVIFDGIHLHFPRFTNSNALSEARRSASELRWELSHGCAEQVDVKAVVAIPGCRIERNGTTEVAIASLEELRDLILNNNESQLTAAQIETVSIQIEQRMSRVNATILTAGRSLQPQSVKAKQ